MKKIKVKKFKSSKVQGLTTEKKETTPSRHCEGAKRLWQSQYKIITDFVLGHTMQATNVPLLIMTASPLNQVFIKGI